MKKARASRRRASPGLPGLPGLLGGAALIGSLGCQSVDPPPSATAPVAAPAPPRDSIRMTLAPHPAAKADTLVPPVYAEVPGGYCGPSTQSATSLGRKMVCTPDSVLLSCGDDLTWKEEKRFLGASMWTACAGDPPKPTSFGMLGFVGIDKAGRTLSGGRRLRPLA